MTTSSQPQRLASVDGRIGPAEEAKIPVLDDGLLRGDGVFEFLRCYLGRPFCLEEHLERMTRSCALLRLPYPRGQVEEEIAALLDVLGPRNRDLRIVLTRAGRRILLLEPCLRWEPARLSLIPDEPRLVIDGAKTLSYAGNMLARRMAVERGMQEALLMRPDGRVMEVQQGAFFWVDVEGTLYTPPLSEGILDSITRRLVLARLPVEELVCLREDALQASEAFVVSSAREVHPVGVIDEHVFGEVPGPFTLRAIDAYWDAVREQLNLSREEVDASGDD